MGPLGKELEPAVSREIPVSPHRALLPGPGHPVQCYISNMKCTGTISTWVIATAEVQWRKSDLEHAEAHSSAVPSAAHSSLKLITSKYSGGLLWSVNKKCVC